MPLGAREILLVIRAKDQASRVIQDIGRTFATTEESMAARGASQMRAGQAMLGAGIAMTATGLAGAAAIGKMVDASIDFNRQAALTLTQIDQVGVSVDDLKKIALDVAHDIPAPLEEMQATLYDIFSSLNVNTDESKVLLTAFAKSAVAGQVSLQDAGRATIAIMNAWGVPTTDVNKLMDVQFQLVRKASVRMESSLRS